MAVEKKSNWTRNIALIVVVIALGAAIGWKANELSEKAAALEAEGSTNSMQGFQLSDDYSPVAVAHRSRLDAEIYYARQEADDWTARFIAYVAGALGLIGLIFFVIPMIEKALATPRREDFADFTELGRRTRAGFTAAASSFNKAISRQPTVGGLSTADELRKWEELRKEGLVTDEEYKKMRDKLVG